MVPKLHKKGNSFAGAAAYLLHDKGKATSSERVEWVETHNLPVDDPHVAWRLMAACALDAPRLKAEAGIKATGRKSTNSVLHMSLAWHPDEAEGLDRAEMVQAAHGALAALGASDRQALLIAHNDEKHPHIHLLINRVSPEDGRMLSSSKEKLKLSAWAERYEKARGQIYCEERVLNNAARARGEFTRAAKETPRHVFELESSVREASAGDPKGFEALRVSEREKDRLLSRKGFDQAERRKAQWQALLRSHHERNAAIRDAEQVAVGKETAAIRARFRPAWRELEQTQREADAAFRDRERTLRGRIYNAFQAWQRADAPDEVTGDAESRAAITSRKFRAASSEGARFAALQQHHAAQNRSLEREQRAEIAEAVADERASREEALALSRSTFEAERMQLLLAQRAADAKLRAEWRTRNQQRRETFARYREAQEHRPPVQPDFRKAAFPSPDPQGTSDPLAARVKPGADGERRFDELQERLRRRAAARKDKEPDRER